jgi:hypothetical protein
MVRAVATLYSCLYLTLQLLKCATDCQACGEGGQTDYSAMLVSIPTSLAGIIPTGKVYDLWSLKII